MITTITRFLIIIFSISCFLVNLYQCYPNPTTTTTAIASNPTQIIDYEILKKIVIEELDKNGKDGDEKDEKDKIAHDLEVIGRAKEKARDRVRKSKERAKERKESVDADNTSNYKHHDGGENDDDKKSTTQNSSKDGNAATSTAPTNTVVTTIVVVSTETPTAIYSDSSSGSAKQKSDTSKNDPNDRSASSSTDNSGTTDSSSNNNPEESQAIAAGLHDQSAFRKLVTALSIVGGIAGIALLIGGLVFTRMKMRKRKRKEADLEIADNKNHHGSQPPPTSPRPPQTIIPSLSNYNPRYGDDNTVIGFSQDPFSDPADLSYSKHMIQSLDHRMSLTPTAPPSLPVNLESPRHYVNYRQNQTLSMLSQTTATTLPSAPSAKELDALAYGNPFDDEGFDITEENEQELRRLGQSHHRRHHPSIANLPVAPDEDTSLPPTVSPPLSNMHDGSSSSSTSSSTSSSSRPFHLQHQTHLQKSQESFSSSADLAPPPAYTPNAPPSAPPLYALPTSTLAIEDGRQQQRQQQEEEDSRRYSINSCSIASSARPLSLRRGSGSPALISFK